jgi:hypothetical protein
VGIYDQSNCVIQDWHSVAGRREICSWKEAIETGSLTEIGAADIETDPVTPMFLSRNQ